MSRMSHHRAGPGLTLARKGKAPKNTIEAIERRLAQDRRRAEMMARCTCGCHFSSAFDHPTGRCPCKVGGQ